VHGSYFPVYSTHYGFGCVAHQVAAVYLRIGGLMCPMARVEELRDAVRAVSQSKPIIGFMVSGGELEIALGASCTELHVSPGGYAHQLIDYSGH
jgi:hypothetical protein